MKNPILSFTVKLSKWRCGGDSDIAANRRGTKDSPTYLRNKFGRQCCLGFACQAGGYNGEINGYLDPSYLEYAIPGLSSLINAAPVNSVFSDEAIVINDDIDTSVKTKQRLLVALGKKHNIKVKFVP